MKKLLFIILLSIFLCPQLIFADALIGPKIYNLQIGMPVSEAKQIIEEICKKYDINCKNMVYGDFIRPFFFNSEKAKAFGNSGYNIMVFYDTDTVIGYTLPFKIFNLSPNMKIETFLEELAKHYNLSLTCNRSNCIEDNEELGFKVDIDLAWSTINVVPIQKTESLQFK